MALALCLPDLRPGLLRRYQRGEQSWPRGPHRAIARRPVFRESVFHPNILQAGILAGAPSICRDNAALHASHSTALQKMRTAISRQNFRHVTWNQKTASAQLAAPLRVSAA